MKTTAILGVAVVIFGLMTGCFTATPSQSAPSATPEGTVASIPTPTPTAYNLLQEMDNLYAQLDTTRLPQQEGNPLAEETADTLPPQLILDTPDSYRLADAIGNLLYFNRNEISDFGAGNPLHKADSGALKAVIYNTAPLQFSFSYSFYSDKYSYTFEDPNHIVAYVMKTFMDNGKEPSDIYDIRDIEDTMQSLFGEDVKLRYEDISPYYYMKRDGFFIRQGDFGGPMWRYPQITTMQKTDDGYICEAVLVSALDKETPLVGDKFDVPLTTQTFEQLTPECQKHRYTFRQEDDGRLVLIGLQNLRPDTYS